MIWATKTTNNYKHREIEHQRFMPHAIDPKYKPITMEHSNLFKPEAELRMTTLLTKTGWLSSTTGNGLGHQER